MAEVITRFKLETTQFDSKLRDASKGLSEFSRQAKEGGSGFTNFSQKAVESARALGTIASGATNAKDKLKDLVGAYNDAARVYNKLSQEQQQSDFGKNLANSISQLKDRITETKNEIYGLGNATKGGFGQFGSIVDDLGHKIGLSGNLTEMLTSKTALLTGAIGAGTTAVIAATKAWADYNSELAKQSQITTVTTGLKGDNADQMTDSARALAKVYGVDFRDAINTANTLMTQFGKTGEESIQLLSDGMQGMILGDGQKLLTMIQQFAPSFRDAGISAEQLVAVIHNSEGGLFSEQNMNAILMGIKNIRLMTKSTSDALAELGIDGEEMSRKMSDGSMTVFEALRQVAEAIEGTRAGSQAAGQVMQAVFGRQGAMQGMKLGRAIAELNLNLEDTKRQTGEVGDQYKKLYEANRELEKAMHDAFGYNGWEVMAVSIKTTLVEALTNTVDYINDIKSAWNSLMSLMGRGTPQKPPSQPQPDGTYWETTDKDGKILASGRWLNGQQVQTGAGEVVVTAPRPSKTKTPKTKTPKRTSAGSKVEKTEEQLNTEAINKLTNEYIKASESRREAIRKEIAELQDKNKKIQELKNQALGKTEEVDLEKLFPTQKVEGESMTLGEQMMAGIQAGMAAKAQDADEQTLKTLLETMMTNGIEGINIPTDRLLEKILGDGADIPDEYWQSLVDEINAKLKELGIEPIKIDLKTGNIEKVTDDSKEMTKSWKSAASAISSVGSAMSSIEDPAAKIAGIIAQAIASIALGFSEMIGKDISSKGNVWYGIAAAAAGIAAMASAISQIHSVTGYAQGGIIKGNSYSGDNIGGIVDGSQFVGLNAGEVVLTKAMQGNLASQLQENGNGMRLTATVSGEQIVLVANRHLKRAGKGELVTWK